MRRPLVLLGLMGALVGCHAGDSAETAQSTSELEKLPPAQQAARINGDPNVPPDVKALYNRSHPKR